MKGTREMMMLLSMIGSISNNDNFFRESRRKKDSRLHGIDIEKEYELIQRKKSGLSSNMRDMVEREYKRTHSEDRK